MPSTDAAFRAPGAECRGQYRLQASYAALSCEVPSLSPSRRVRRAMAGADAHRIAIDMRWLALT
eukprot:348586-Rhodomonas_salina.10